jgi:aminoglycoside phosphotransferase (APT) family kinase protein
MNVMETVRDALAAEGLRLRKVEPCGADQLAMEVSGADGRIGAAQWHGDPREAGRIAEVLRARYGGDAGHLTARHHLLVQQGGADRTLSPLRRLVDRPGAVLVTHRPERRAVVRLEEHRYMRVVRPGHTASVVGPLIDVRPAGVRVPVVLHADDSRGLVTISEMSGRTLHERLGDHRLSDEELSSDGKQIGAAVRILHGHRARVSRLVHDRTAEMAAAHRWLSAAARFGMLRSGAWREREEQVESLLPDIPPELALLHRDLHDTQIVLQDGEPVALLDLALATYGDPALDLANLLVHIDLRARQGLCSTRRARMVATGVLDGYSADPDLLRRLPAYAASTRLRLAGVYAFRETPPGLVDDLLHPHSEKDDQPWL